MDTLLRMQAWHDSHAMRQRDRRQRARWLADDALDSIVKFGIYNLREKDGHGSKGYACCGDPMAWPV